MGLLSGNSPSSCLGNSMFSKLRMFSVFMWEHTMLPKMGTCVPMKGHRFSSGNLQCLYVYNTFPSSTMPCMFTIL